MVARASSLERSGEEKGALEKIVLKLRGQLKDLERIDMERQDLEDKLKALQQQLREKVLLDILDILLMHELSILLLYDGLA